MNAIELAERGWVPDVVTRMGIRRLLRARLRSLRAANPAEHASAKQRIVDTLRRSPLAEHTEAANEQHYEVPAPFFQLVLGPHLKYSCCQYLSSQDSLMLAEEQMLATTCRRAQLKDGQQILELGCGWGSLTLWMAARYPRSHVTAVSNSHAQRRFIEQRADERGLDNVRVITADVRDFDIAQTFDRVVSIEMFEHMRNYERLLENISRWLQPDGKLFVHVFTHRDTPYLFETEGKNDWMGRHFFTGGLMPSTDLLLHFPDHLGIERQWHVDGTHYARTCRHWLQNLDRNQQAIQRIFEERAPEREARVMVQRWRMFFMACEELFRFRNGREWFVAHYLFHPHKARTTPPPRQAVFSDDLLRN